MTDDDLEEVPRATGRTALLIAAPVLAVMLAFVWILASSEPATDREVSSPLLDNVAPELKGSTIAGTGFDLDNRRGQYVVVNFFATWCTPCLREHPELVRFSERHAAAGDASVVSIVYDDQSSDARQFFIEQGGDWPVVLDPDGRVALEYGVAGIPESFIVAPDGTVVAKVIGGVTANGLDQLIREVSGG